MVDMNIPVLGVARAESSLATAASRIARAPLSAAEDTPADTVDLSAEMVALMESRDGFEANIQVAKTFDQMNQSVLDILA